MDFIGIILLLRLLIILKLFSGSSAAKDTATPAPDPKSFICVVDTGVTFITKLPDECTAIASYATNTDTGSNAIDILRRDRDLPYLLIIDNYSNDDLQKRLESDDIQGFVDEISKEIQRLNAQAVVFDNMNSDQKSGEVIQSFQLGLQKLVAGLKKDNQNLTVGLGLTKDEAELSRAFDKKMVDACMDFYVADTVLYNKCEHKNRQSDMANIAPFKEIEKTLIMMDSMGYSADKLLFIIRILVKDTSSGSAEASDDTSYSDMCSKKHDFGKKRKFCVEFLTNFYKKGKLVSDRKMRGVIVQAVDRDDFNKNCGPTSFPAVKSIKAGMDGKPEPTDITQEPNWAKLGRDQDDGGDDGGHSDS